MSLSPAVLAATAELLFEVAPGNPAMVSLLLASKAPATVRNYASSIRRYRKFAGEADLPFLPDERAVAAFLLHLHAGEETLATVNACAPALTWLLALNNQADIFLRPQMQTLLAGVRREAAKLKPPIRKPGVLSPAQVHQVLVPALHLVFTWFCTGSGQSVGGFRSTPPEPGPRPMAHPHACVCRLQGIRTGGLFRPTALE